MRIDAALDGDPLVHGQVGDLGVDACDVPLDVVELHRAAPSSGGGQQRQPLGGVGELVPAVLLLFDRLDARLEERSEDHVLEVLDRLVAPPDPGPALFPLGQERVHVNGDDPVLDELVHHLVDLHRGEQDIEPERVVEVLLHPVPVRGHAHGEGGPQGEEVEGVHHADGQDLAVQQRRLDQLDAGLIELDREDRLVVTVERGLRGKWRIDLLDEPRLVVGRRAAAPAAAPRPGRGRGLLPEDDEPHGSVFQGYGRQPRRPVQPVDPPQLSGDVVQPGLVERKVHLEREEAPVAGAAAELQELDLRNIHAGRRVADRTQPGHRGQVVVLQRVGMVAEDRHALDECVRRLQKQHGQPSKSRISVRSSVASLRTVFCVPSVVKYVTA